MESSPRPFQLKLMPRASLPLHEVHGCIEGHAIVEQVALAADLIVGQLVGFHRDEVRRHQLYQFALREAAAEALRVAGIHGVVMAREPGQHHARRQGMERGVRAQQRRAGRLAEEDELIEADVIVEVAGAHRQLELVIEEAASDFAENRGRFRTIGLENRRRNQVAQGLIGGVARIAKEPAR